MRAVEALFIGLLIGRVHEYFQPIMPNVISFLKVGQETLKSSRTVMLSIPDVSSFVKVSAVKEIKSFQPFMVPSHLPAVSPTTENANMPILVPPAVDESTDLKMKTELVPPTPSPSTIEVLEHKLSLLLEGTLCQLSKLSLKGLKMYKAVKQQSLKLVASTQQQFSQFSTEVFQPKVSLHLESVRTGWVKVLSVSSNWLSKSKSFVVQATDGVSDHVVSLGTSLSEAIVATTERASTVFSHTSSSSNPEPQLVSSEQVFDFQASTPPQSLLSLPVTQCSRHPSSESESSLPAQDGFTSWILCGSQAEEAIVVVQPPSEAVPVLFPAPHDRQQLASESIDDNTNNDSTSSSGNNAEEENWVVDQTQPPMHDHFECVVPPSLVEVNTCNDQSQVAPIIQASETGVLDYSLIVPETTTSMASLLPVSLSVSTTNVTMEEVLPTASVPIMNNRRIKRSLKGHPSSSSDISSLPTATPAMSEVDELLPDLVAELDEAMEWLENFLFPEGPVADSNHFDKAMSYLEETQKQQAEYLKAKAEKEALAAAKKTPRGQNDGSRRENKRADAVGVMGLLLFLILLGLPAIFDIWNSQRSLAETRRRLETEKEQARVKELEREQQRERKLEEMGRQIAMEFSEMLQQKRQHQARQQQNADLRELFRHGIPEGEDVD